MEYFLQKLWAFVLNNVLSILTLLVYCRQANIMSKQNEIMKTQTRLLEPNQPTIIAIPYIPPHDTIAPQQLGLYISIYNNAQRVIIVEQIEIISNHMDFRGKNNSPTKCLPLNKHLRASGFTNKDSSPYNPNNPNKETIYLSKLDSDFILNLCLFLTISEPITESVPIDLRISILDCNQNTTIYPYSCSVNTTEHYTRPAGVNTWLWE
jgi:hypothetical protein